MGGSSNGGGGDGNTATAEVATDLVALARSDDPPCARNAVGALANLSENNATHERVLGWGASFLSKLALEIAPHDDGAGVGFVNGESEDGGGVINSNVGDTGDGGGGSGDGQATTGGAGGMDVGLVREVTRCLANLAGNYATHEKLLDGCVADALVGSLNREDAVTARFAALGLANLSAQVGGRIERFIEMLRTPVKSKLFVPKTSIDNNCNSTLHVPCLFSCLKGAKGVVSCLLIKRRLQVGSPRCT